MNIYTLVVHNDDCESGYFIVKTYKEIPKNNTINKDLKEYIYDEFFEKVELTELEYNELIHCYSHIEISVIDNEDHKICIRLIKTYLE